jgi:AraC family transcriptional regulator of arabinose operon
MDRRIRAAIETIHNDADCRFDLLKLARQANLSPTRFSHLFKAETSLSPQQYLYQWRLRLAKALLNGTFLKVNQVAARLGYRRASDLTRAFSKFYGHPPSVRRHGIAREGQPPGRAAGYEDEVRSPDRR